MRKGFILCLFLAGFSGLALAQDQETGKKGFDKSKMFVGGYLGLSFSSYGTAINISPQVGYQFNPYVAAGVGLNYSYYNYKTYYGSTPLQQETYSYLGMNIFGRFYPIPQIFVQAQPEVNYVWGNVSYYGNGPDYKIPSQFVPSLLLGGGAAIPAGRGSLLISVMYDVIQNAYSPYYRQAVYSFGYMIGF